MRPLIIAGIPRTGTTITARVIATHPEINMTNEKRIIWAAVQLLDRLSLRYPNENSPFVIRVDNRKEFERIKGYFVNGLRLAIKDAYDVERYAYFGDKFPHYIYRMDTINRLFPTVKYILTYNSNIEYCTKSMLSQWWAHNMTAEKYKAMFDRGMAIIDRKRGNPDVYILDLAKFRASPKEEIKKVAAFLGLENKFDVTGVKP